MRRDVFDKFFANSSNEDNKSSYEAPYFARDPRRNHSRYSGISTQQQKITKEEINKSNNRVI
jgi:hypothetical protein